MKPAPPSPKQPEKHHDLRRPPSHRQARERHVPRSQHPAEDQLPQALELAPPIQRTQGNETQAIFDMSKIYETGLHAWQYGRVVDWHPNRAPARWLLGPCPNCGSCTSNYGLTFGCHNDYCASSPSNFACSAGDCPDWWNTDINVFKDGSAWCATRDGFIDLQVSIAGFGDSPKNAVADLIKNEKLQNS